MYIQPEVLLLLLLLLRRPRVKPSTSSTSTASSRVNPRLTPNKRGPVRAMLEYSEPIAPVQVCLALYLNVLCLTFSNDTQTIWSSIKKNSKLTPKARAREGDA